MLCYVMFVRNAACERVRGSFAQLFTSKMMAIISRLALFQSLPLRPSIVVVVVAILLLCLALMIHLLHRQVIWQKIEPFWIGFDFLISMIGSIFSRMYHMANCTWWFVNVAKALAGVSNWLFIKHCRTQTWIRWAHDLLCVWAVCLFLALYPSFYIHYFI